MWPFSEMSISAASLIGTVANWALLVSLLTGLLSTFLIVQTTDVKERLWEMERLKLQAKIAPRRLTVEQTSKIIASLAGTRSIEIGVVSRLLDPEGSDFADDLAAALKGGNWRPTRFVDWTRSDKGVQIGTVGGTEVPEYEALVAALDSADIQHGDFPIAGEDINRISARFQPGFLYLLVGAKP